MTPLEIDPEILEQATQDAIGDLLAIQQIREREQEIQADENR